jgi:restriction endonuclease Mrr
VVQFLGLIIGFDYLVEAKWRSDQPNEQEIAGFKQKVDTKLDATRGMFVSINGFRDEVVAQFQGRGANIIFMDGEDLTHILEGRVDLPDALRTKIEKAAQEGNVFFRVRDML